MHDKLLPEIDQWASTARALDIIDEAAGHGSLGVVIVASHNTTWLRDDLDELHKVARDNGLLVAHVHYVSDGRLSVDDHTLAIAAARQGRALGLGQWLELPALDPTQLYTLQQVIAGVVESQIAGGTSVALLCDSDEVATFARGIAGTRIVARLSDAQPSAPWAHIVDDLELVEYLGSDRAYQIATTRDLLPPLQVTTPAAVTTTENYVATDAGLEPVKVSAPVPDVAGDDLTPSESPNEVAETQEPQGD